MIGGGLIQLLTVGVEDAPLILNPEITFFKTVYRKHTNFSMEQIVKNIGTKKFDCFHQFKIEKVTDLLAGLHFIIDIPYFDVLKTVTSEIINNPDIININELSIMYSNIKTYLFFESISNKYYLIPETFFNLSEIDNFTNSVESVELQQNLLNDLFIENRDIFHVIPSHVNILQLKNSTLNQLLPVIRLNFDNWTEFWLKIINKKENFNYFTRLLSQLSLIDDFNKRLNLIIYDKFNNYNIFYDYKEYLNFSDEIKNYYLLENNVLENPIFDSDYAVNYAIKNNLDIEKCKLETIKFNSLFFLFLLQTIYPDFTTNIKSFTFWKKYNLYENNNINNELPVTTNNYFLEWSNRFNFYKETSYGIEYEKLNIEIYNNFFKKYNECEININALFNTIDIKEKEKLWCILYTIYLRFNNKDTNTTLNKICFDDYFTISPFFSLFFMGNNTSSQDISSIFIENEINKNIEYYNSLKNINLVKDNLSNFDKYGYIQPVDLALIYVYLCYNYIESITSDEIFNNYQFLVYWRNKINIAYFFRTADILDNYKSDNIKNNSLKNVFNSLHDYNETNKLLTFYHNIDLTREINLDIIRDELIKTIYSESFFGTVDIETNNLDVNDITISPYQTDSSGYTIKNQIIEISEDLIVNFTIENTKIIINNWNRNSFNQLFIKNNGSYVEMSNFEITDNKVYITNQNLNLDNLSTINIRTINKFKIPIVNIKDISNNSLCNTSGISNRIILYNSTINNINNKQILCNINYNKNYFYQLDIKYIDNSIERINVDFSNNYFILETELNLNFNKIKNINLDCIDLNYEFIADVNNNDFSSNNLDFKIVIPQNQTINNLGSFTANYFLIATQFNNKRIIKKNFISVIYYNSNYYGTIAEHFFRIYGNINLASYKYSLFRFKSDNTSYKPIPNLFSILHHNKNPSLKNYSINQSFYQLPMIFNIITTNNLPLYIFYNINMSENASIKLNNNNVNKLCQINSSQFYNYTSITQVEIFPGYFVNNTEIGIVPIIFEYTNLKSQNYLSKPDLVNKLIEKFDKVFINNSLYGNIINLLEKSNKLYKNLINDSIKLLKKLGKSIEHVIDTSIIINEINLLNYSNRDFDVYSVLAPKYYDISSMSLGMNTINISNEWFIFKQIKDIYKPSNKISTNLSNYLKNVSKTILKHVDHIKDNYEIIEIFNRNQFQEKYDYFYILANSIQNNWLTIDNYNIQTLYDMDNNYSDENTEIYFNNMLIDISSNNVVSGTNLFEINNNNTLLTEKFIENKDNYSNEKFNYLGPVEFKNGNFNFNNNITNIQYILTDDLEIIDLSNVNMINLKTYYNSYRININESYINSNFTTTKYIYELEIPSYSVTTLLNKGILISGNYYDFFKNNNYILIGEKELVLTPNAIIGDSSGSMKTFIPTTTINILNIKIINNFKSNIKILGNHTNKLIKKYNKIEFITIIPGNTFIELSWNTPYTDGKEITNYLIQKSTDLFKWDNILSSNTSFKLSNLINDKIYYFKLSVINNTDPSLESNIFIGIPKADIPSKIESIAIIPGNTFIDLSWDAPYNGGTEITSYLIQQSTDLYNWVNISSTTRLLRINNLLNDKIYYFKLQAITNTGSGLESNIFIGIPKLLQSPVSAKNIKSITIIPGNTFIDLSWNIPSTITDISSYLIQQSTDLSNWINLSSNTTSFRVSNLLNDTIYYFIIKGINNVTIQESNIFIGIIKSVVPSKIESIVITSGNTFIDFIWGAPYNGGTEITSYLIQRSKDLNNWVNLSSTTRSLRITNLLNDRPYYFKLKAINKNGSSLESNIYIGIPKLVPLLINTQYKLIDSITNGIETYYSIESLNNIQLYDFSKNELPPFNIINNKISYNYDNKNFIIDNFNNDYWYKLDTSIIQGVNLKNLNISGNYNLYLYPNKFLKLVEIFTITTNLTNELGYDFNYVDGTILNGRLILTNSHIIPNYSYISINNYVYFIKDVSSNYLLDDYLVVNINTPTRVYLLDNSHFKKCPSQYISIINTSSTEKFFPYPNVTPNTIIITSVTPGNGQVTLSWSSPLSDPSPINRYRVFSIQDRRYIIVSGTTLTGTIKGLTNGRSYNFTVIAEDLFNNFLFISNNSTSVIPTNVVIDNVILDNLSNLVPSYSYDFKNKQELELDLYIRFSSIQYNFIRPINFTSNGNVFRVKLSRNSLNYGNFFYYKQSDLVKNQISGTITDISNNSINGLLSIDDNFKISGTTFTLTSKEEIQKYKLYDSNNNYTYIWTLLLDDNNHNLFDIQLSNQISDPIIINSNSTLIVNLSNYTASTNNNNLLSVSNNQLYFNNYFTNITKKQMYYSSSIIGEYKLEKLENNYNSSDIIYCNLDDLGIIQETDINGNELSIDNFDIYKYILLLDTSSNYKYYNVLSSDILLNKIIVDGEIEKKIYNAYGFKRNLIFIKNKSSIWKSLTNYYLDTKKNCLFIDDIIMINNNIFKVIGLNSLKNLYEIELIRKYNDLKLFSDGYYILYSKNIVPNIPKFEPIVDFTIDDTNNNNYRFRLTQTEFLQMEPPIPGESKKFCIKEGNDIILYYKNGKLYNPFNYFLNNDDYIFLPNVSGKFKISFIFNDVINLQTTFPYNEGYYTFHYPYQPCTMENLIFDNNGILLNYYKKNINYYFEYKNVFYKEFQTKTIFNSALYTRVIKIPKNQFYFDNKKIDHIEGKLVDGNLIEINENLSNDNFFYNQPILINNTIKLIKLQSAYNKYLVTNDFISQDLDLETNNDQKLKIYLGKKNIQNIYSNYLLDNVNYLKPKININKFDYYYILNENTQDEQIIYKSLRYLDNNSEKYMNSRSPPLNPHILIFEDNVLLYDSSFNFLNYNNSYHILLEKIETNQYISHLCKIKFQNKLKLFTPIENYKSKFYLDKIYPIKLNIDNTFEYLDIIIYKQTILNKKPPNEIHIFKKFNISVNGIVESLNDNNFKVEVNIGDLSNYISNSEIYTNNKTLCTIDISNSLYYLKTSTYPGEFEYLYIKKINYITYLFRNNFNYIYEKFNESQTRKLIEKYPTNESIKLPVYLKQTSRTNFNLQYNIDSPDYSLTSYTYYDRIDMGGYFVIPPPVHNLNNALIENITDSEMNDDNYSLDNLNNIIMIGEKSSINSGFFTTTTTYKYVITSANPITNDETYIYFNNIRTNIFNESTLQCDIESIFEILFFETDFHHSILFNKLKPWNSWSILTNKELENSIYLIKGLLIYDLSNGLKTHIVNNPNTLYFTNNEFSDLSQSLSSTSFSIDKYNKIKFYQEKIYSYLNSFFKYYEFWKDPTTYINNFAIDISSQIIFDGLHLKLNGKEIDDIIINNQFDISYNTTHTIYYISRNKNKIQDEIYNFINNIKNDSLYGVNILDVLKELVKISNNLINIKNIIKNTSFETKNFTDLLLNILKNELYGKTSNLDIDLTELKKSFVVENFQLNDNDVKDNIITFDKSYNFVNDILEYPTDTFKIMNMVNIPYNINYSIDTQSGLYLYKITLLDEKYESYIIYKLDFLSGINTLIEPITINNPLVFNNQINFYYKENFDINIDYVISSFKTYDVSSECLGYLYQVDISSINFNDFTTIKYKQEEFTSYDNYLVSPIYLESFSSYIQAETPIGIYQYDISNNQTKITLIKLNISINITSSQYSVYYNDNSNYYKIIDIDISKNIITIDSVINKFTNPKIVVTIKSPTTSNSVFNNTKLYRLTLDEPLSSYADYINFKNVPNNFLINDEIKIIDMKFITDSIVDVIINSSLSETYNINNLVHYAKIGEYPPEPIKVLDRTNQYLYRFNKFVPFNDISSCFIVYDPNYNKNINSTEYDLSFNTNFNSTGSVYIDHFIRNIGSANYNLSTNVIQDLYGIKFITTRFLTNEEMQYNVFGGVINTFNISNYIYNSSNKTITFTIPQKLIIDLDYYYILNNTYLDISNISINQNKLIINWIGGVISGIIVFKQVIIEKEIIKPMFNQIYNIELFNNLDLNTNGYLHVLNNEGNEVGQFIYKINTSINDLLNTYDVLINNSNMLKGTILYKNPLYIITNKLIENIYSLTIVDTSITLTNISGVLIQNTYIPYEIYKSNGLKNYSLFINNNIYDIGKLNFLSTDKNKFSIIGRYGKFKLEKIYQNQKIEPTPELVFNLQKKISYVKQNQIETVKFNSDIYKNIFESIDFCIGDQIIERLDKTTFEMQYQFLKDPQKKNQIEKVTKMYDYEGKIRLVIPLEFWFNNQANMYLPLISLPYTDVSIKFKLNKLNQILSSNYTIISEPEINIQVNIDGIILDTFERDMFGNNKHEYLIERFMQYPDNLIDKTSSVIKMIFKNPIKDIYYKTEVLGSSDTCYYTTKIIIDDWQKEYINKRELYNEFIKTGIYTNNNSNSKEFEIIRIAINENILQNSVRYNSFNNSKILRNYDMEMTIYLDEKYQKNLKLERRKYNLELYYTKIYNYKEIKTSIPIIDSLVIKANGKDLFKEINHTYFNKIIPYQKYLNSVDIGYYVYSFSLNPLDNQPSGHLNFSLFDDIVLKSENNYQVVTKPVILKTIVREYNLLRIMSGLSSLAWVD
jgi:hypothetical protein